MSDIRQIKQANNFLQDEQSQLSPAYLLSLKNQGTPESREQLCEIADNYNVVYTDDNTDQEIYDMVTLAMEQEADNERLGGPQDPVAA